LANVGFQFPNFTKQFTSGMFLLKFLDLFCEELVFFGTWISPSLNLKSLDRLSSQNSFTVETFKATLLPFQVGHSFPQGQVGVPTGFGFNDKVSLQFLEAQPVVHQVEQRSQTSPPVLARKDPSRRV
jgi:hypothetical protein